MIDQFSLYVQQGDLVIAWSETARKRQSLILPYLDGDPVAKLVAQLVSGTDRLRVRVLRPPADLSSDAATAWHMDAWITLPDEARRSGVLVAGPTAIQLIGVRARTMCAVAPPNQTELRARRVSEYLRASDPTSSPVFSANLNRQSRLLLRNTDRLRDGRPLAAEKLRRAMKRATLLPMDELPDVAQAVARVLKLDQTAARRQASRILEEHHSRDSLEGLSAEKVTQFMTLNHLDVLLWELAREGRAEDHDQDTSGPRKEAGRESSGEASSERTSVQAGPKRSPQAGPKRSPQAGPKRNGQAGSKRNGQAGSKRNGQAGSKRNGRAGAKRSAQAGPKRNGQAASKGSGQADATRIGEAGSEGRDHGVSKRPDQPAAADEGEL